MTKTKGGELYMTNGEKTIVVILVLFGAVLLLALLCKAVGGIYRFLHRKEKRYPEDVLFDFYTTVETVPLEVMTFPEEETGNISGVKEGDWLTLRRIRDSGGSLFVGFITAEGKFVGTLRSDFRDAILPVLDCPTEVTAVRNLAYGGENKCSLHIVIRKKKTE